MMELDQIHSASIKRSVFGCANTCALKSQFPKGFNLINPQAKRATGRWGINAESNGTV